MTFKYHLLALFVVAPAALILWLTGGHFIHFVIVLLILIYVEVLEINDKLKK